MKEKGLYTLSELNIAVLTSDVSQYDGQTLVNIVFSPTSSLNDIIKAVDDVFTTIIASFSTINSSQVTYDGTPTFGCFAIVGSLNDVIDQIGNKICSLATNDIAYNGVAAVNYTPTAATASGHFKGIDNRLGTMLTSIATINSTLATLATLTGLYTHIEGITNNFVSSGAGLTTSGISLNVSIATANYYVDGKRFTYGGATVTLAATSDNYIDIQFAGTFLLQSVPIGNPVPAVSGLRLYKITTDGIGTTASVDLRNIYPFDGSLLADNSIATRHILDANVTTAKLSNTGVAAGATVIANVTVDVKGRITAIGTHFTLAGLADEDILIYDIGLGKFVNSPFLGTILPTASDHDYLVFDAGTNKWVNETFNTGVDYTSVALDTSFSITAGVSNNVCKITSISTTTTTANRVITLVPSAVGGINNHFKIIIGFGKIGVGFTWKIKVGATTLVTLTEGSFLPTEYDFYWDGATYIVTRKPIDIPTDPNNEDILTVEQTFVSEWDFAGQGGAVSTITLANVLPAGAIVKANEFIIECLTPLTSGGAATVAWGITGFNALFDGARSFGAAPYTTGGEVDYGVPGIPGVLIKKVTVPSNITITIGTAALTAGKIRIFVPFIVDI